MLSNLRTLREAAGYSRRQLSQKSGVGERSIVYAENGRDVRLTTALRLADALGCGLLDLIGDAA